MAQTVTVGVEILDILPGLWCRRCVLSTAVRVRLVMRTPRGMSMLMRDQCRGCGSHDVAVTEDVA